MFKEEHLVMAGQANLATMHFLKERIAALEKVVLKRAKLKGEYHNLLTVPGIGKILALRIMLENGEITRFPEVGNYVSYCRCVGSSRLANGKSKGEGNRKNGNKYLSWAYVEAANYAIRLYP
jgi:transposase